LPRDYQEDPVKQIVAGVFVGGRARRFGGLAKGLLRAPDTNEPIVSRLARVTREAIPDSKFVLVGDARNYAALGHDSIADEPEGVGPIGALIALLSHAARIDRDAIAFAADLPFVSRDLVSRLALHAPDSSAVAPRVNGIWHPMFARYRSEPSLDAARTVLATGSHALHRVLSQLGSSAAELPLTPVEAELLRDWDAPGDVSGG
jgi:molybdopterin-guanine dinucleotide biosynthesis protein A